MVWLERQTDADATLGIIHGRCHSSKLRRSVCRAPCLSITTLCRCQAWMSGARSDVFNMEAKSGAAFRDIGGFGLFRTCRKPQSMEHTADHVPDALLRIISAL